jgi:uncharacterized protein (TIGR00725 family)
VCGASQASEQEIDDAEQVGRLLAARGAVVVCGGLGGVMAAVARGVRAGGGTCIGVLPGDDADTANPDVTLALPTGMGEMRNALIARSCRAMIAIGGGYGTLSEIALGLRLGRPVIGLRTWALQRPAVAAAGDDLPRATSAADAVEWVLARV